MAPGLTATAIADATGALKQLLGARASDAASVRDHHSRGESYHAAAAPDVVCFPHTTDEVAAIVNVSARHRLPNGTIGRRWRALTFTIAATSSVVCGKQTTSGAAAASPSI